MRTVLRIIGLVAFVSSGVIAQEPGPFAPPKAEPPIVIAGRTIADPPSDAIVLFDGKDLSRWRGQDGAPARWTIRDGYVEVAPGAGDITTRDGFGDLQLHIEWATPAVAKGEGQERGNSGVFLMEQYEIQVLDSYDNKTYFHGQAGSVYKQHAPLVNASRPPGQWQSYDIVFRRPRFYPDGSLARPAHVTVLHNGVVVHDATELFGPTTHKVRKPYSAHADKLPLLLQDHGDRVRYRNIWVRELGEVP